MVGRKRKVLEETKGKIRPLGDRVLVRMEVKPGETYSTGGIFLPPSVEEDRTTARGTVEAVGPGILNDDGTYTPLDCEENDIIIFGKYAGTEVKQHGVEYRIMHAADVLAIIGHEPGLTPSEEEQGFPDEGQMKD